jgi:hypothetical protein
MVVAPASEAIHAFYKAYSKKVGLFHVDLLKPSLGRVINAYANFT